MFEHLKRRRSANEPMMRSLRDASFDELQAVEGQVDPVGYRRVRHVLTENQRALVAIKALQDTDGDRVRLLFAASHTSLRDDYEVSCHELDVMVRAADDAPGCVASRMTGGGFGGCTLNLVERERAEVFVEHVTAAYLDETGRVAEAIITAASDGLSTRDLR